MSHFARFCAAFPFDTTRRAEQAKAFLWFLLRDGNATDADLTAVCGLFETAGLPKANITRLREGFARDREVHRGRKQGAYRLAPSAIARYEETYGALFEANQPIEVKVKANVSRTPFLTTDQVNDAYRMAQLYVVMHCYENSARHLIENVLSARFGSEWWDGAASAEMKRSVESRRANESKAKWLKPRGQGPLFYVDWSDLVKLIRKFESDFLPFVKDIKFAELRMEELERLRNVVAHHGMLPSEQDFDRVLISFSDWCAQTS